MIHVVLYQPEIPPNTGSISRQCVGMDASLHIVGPINFDMSDRAVKRAGLDYWDKLRLFTHDNPDLFIEWLGDRDPWLVTRFGKTRYERPDYRDEDILVFGNETYGLPEEWTTRWSGRTLYIPMPGDIRNYNLSNTVSIVLAQASLKAGVFDNPNDRNL